MTENKKPHIGLSLHPLTSGDYYIEGLLTYISDLSSADLETLIELSTKELKHRSGN